MATTEERTMNHTRKETFGLDRLHKVFVMSTSHEQRQRVPNEILSMTESMKSCARHKQVSSSGAWRAEGALPEAPCRLEMYPCFSYANFCHTLSTTGTRRKVASEDGTAPLKPETKTCKTPW